MEDGGSVVQETRLYDSAKNETRSMRSKEEANDYRYFPDPDLLPVAISDELLIEIKKELPELPTEKKIRFVESLGLSPYDAEVLTSQKEVAEYFENIIAKSDISLTSSGGHCRTITVSYTHLALQTILLV